MRMVLDLFDLPREHGPRRSISEYGQADEKYFRAKTTSGSTASNIIGITVGRQWLGIHERGVDYAQDGYDGQVVMVTNMAHSSAWKGASIAGIGRKQVIEVPGMDMTEGGCDGEERDLEEVMMKLKKAGKAILVFLAFGEVNTGFFPRNTRRIAEMCKKYNAYLHIEGAFGIYARCSPKYAYLAEGLEHAHSITACGHKWLNVPYDCSIFIYRRSLEKTIMEPVLSSEAAYLQPSETPFSHPMNIAMETSQRFRALPVWATLRAYGRDGYRRIIEENCRFAKTMFDWMKFTRPDLYTVLTEVCPLNIIVFAKTLQEEEKNDSFAVLKKKNADLLERMNMTGVANFSPTTWKGRPAIRAAISNWKTTVELDWEPVRIMLEEQATIL
ncbi:hypothetical protein BGX26_001246 [Mortierella sp. AD094]|nr:hypothetical protein BGX26_001246 [Mortierella sp. AD094]